MANISKEKWVCYECGKHFRYRVNLIAHKRALHGITPDQNNELQTETRTESLR